MIDLVAARPVAGRPQLLVDGDQEPGRRVVGANGRQKTPVGQERQRAAAARALVVLEVERLAAGRAGEESHERATPT